MRLFFHPNPESENQLSEEESQHAVKVLRLKEKDPISIIDGKGHLFAAEISKANFKKCEFRILSKKQYPLTRNYYLHIAIGPTKNIDRTEWFVEKAVEIGIDEISFLQSEHSERKNINIERIEKIAVSAMKQSMNMYIPKINPLISYSTFILENKNTANFIAHLEEGERKLLKNEVTGKQNICILIGPEGDFSPEEIKLALQNQFIPVSLGESRLRTETAGIVACNTVNLVNG